MYVPDALTMIGEHVFNALAPDVPALTLIMEKVAPEYRCIKA